MRYGFKFRSKENTIISLEVTSPTEEEARDRILDLFDIDPESEIGCECLGDE